MRSPVRRLTLFGSAAALALPWRALQAQPAPIRLAQSVPLSGPVAPFFEAILAGQRMALDEANAAGGVRGRRVELSVIDDRYDPAATVANVRRLIDTQSPAAIVGLGNTAAVAQCLPLALQSQVPLIGPYTGSPGLRAQPHPFFFTTFASYVDELVQMVRALVGVGYKRHAVAYMDNEFGRGMLPALRQVAAAAGAEVVAAEAVAVDGSNAVEAVARLRPSAPHAVVAFAFGAAVVAVVKAQHAMLKTPIYALSVANSRAVIAALGAAGRGLAFTQLIPYPWRRVSPLVRDFWSASDSARVEVGYDSFFGYLNLRAVLSMLRRAAEPADAAALVAAMGQPLTLDLGGYTLQYGPQQRHGSRFVELVVLGAEGRYLR